MKKMKMKVVFIAVLSIAFGLTGCNPKKVSNDDLGNEISTTYLPKRQTYRFMEVLDSVSSRYPNKTKNEIQNKRFREELLAKIDSCLKIDNDFLSDVPGKLVYMSQKRNENNYILAFECGNRLKYNEKLTSRSSHIYAYFRVSTVVPEEIAVDLVEGNEYYVCGIYTGANDRIPTTCEKSPFQDDYDYCSVCLGGFCFSDVSISN